MVEARENSTVESVGVGGCESPWPWWRKCQDWFAAQKEKGFRSVLWGAIFHMKDKKIDDIVLATTDKKTMKCGLCPFVVTTHHGELTEHRMITHFEKEHPAQLIIDKLKRSWHLI